MNRQLIFFASCDIGNSLVVIDEIGRYIFEVEKKSGISKCVVELKNLGSGRVLYQCAERYNDKIFFFPFTINNAPIIVYHFMDQMVEYINLQEKSGIADVDYQLVQRVNDTVWIFPVSLEDDLLMFHMDSETIECISVWRSIDVKIQLDSSDNYSKVGTVVEVGGMIYQTIVKTNMVLEVAKQDYKANIYTLPEGIKLFRSMDYNGSSFWIPDMQDNVIEWTPQQGVKNIFPIVDEKKGGRNKWVILCGKKYLWLLPYQRASRIVQLEYETGIYHVLDIFQDHFIYNLESTKRMFGQMHKNGNIVDIYPFNGNLSIHIDLENDSLLNQYETIMLPKEWSDEYIIKNELQSEYELDRISLSYYLPIFLGNIQDKERITANLTYGKKIWASVTQKL